MPPARTGGARHSGGMRSADHTNHKDVTMPRSLIGILIAIILIIVIVMLVT